MMGDEEDELSYAEKAKLPYSLLLHPATGRAAAYTNNHRVISDLASKKLVAFALQNAAKRDPWREDMHDPTSPWRTLPEWATPEVRAECVLLWIDRINKPTEWWRSMPKR